MVAPIGELAALGTAVCWAGSSLSFEASGKRIGSLSVNLIRLVFAIGFLAIINGLYRGHALPVDASAHTWQWLSISGLVGFTFGDMCLFRAFVVLGARLSALTMNLVPIITALIGWLVLGETLSAFDLAGMSLTIFGVAWTVTERTPLPPGSAERKLGRGLLLALGGAVGQAVGLVLAKYGMGEYGALAATEIRVIAGIVGFAVVFTVIGWWPRVWAARRDLPGIGFTVMGAIFGPVIGVGLSLFAVQHTQTGIASSIMATTPVLLIPLVAILRRERATARGVAGALIALAGVVLLFR